MSVKNLIICTGLTAVVLAGCEPHPPEPVEKVVENEPAETQTDLAMAYNDPEAYRGINPASEQTSVERVEFSLDRISKIDKAGPHVQSVLTLNPEALNIAKSLDAEETERGLLHGVPVLIKDNVETKDMPTTAGSYTLQKNDTGRDAPLVEALREAGAVILGKSNLSQWANFRSTNSTSGWSALGAQTKNPHALNRSPCGSSSGSGAAVAAGLVPAAIGTETNGSIICPAAMNGIVGFKPTVGLISQDLIVPISSTQDTAGPMTLTVEDAAIMMDALTGEGSAWRDAAMAGTLQGKRIGVLNFARGDVEGVNTNFDMVLETLNSQGATLIEINEFEPPEEFNKASFDVLKYEFKATLNEYLAETSPDVKSRTLADIISENAATPAEMAVFDQDILEMSEELGDLEGEEYKAALALVLKTTRDDGIDKMMSENELDALVAPSTAPTFLIDHVYGDNYPGGTGAGWIAAIAGYPHITVPMGSVKDLPVGVSFMGQGGDDKAIMAIGYAFEQAGGDRITPGFINAIEQLPKTGTVSRN
ncbi:amidase [Litorimonas haliclonae]|uniref:amidase n=1 Tax=Litorimonas haliclonae TaxID=2081977 RepID=UPI0039EEFF71